MAYKTASRTDSRLAARLAALASLGAAVIHFAVVPAHWQEWMPAGLFFAALALCQLCWAWLVLTRTTTTVLAGGILLSLGAIALWIMSRTAGAPFGPHAGQPEAVHAADLCALLLQTYVVMGAGWVWYRGRQGELVSAFASATVLLGAVGVVALASTVGAASGLRHEHHAPVGVVDEHHGTHAEHAGNRHDHQAPAPQQPVAETLGTPAEPLQEVRPLPATVPAHADHGDHDHGG